MRGHIEIVHTGEITPDEVPGSGWQAARVRLLSHDPDNGAMTGAVELPPGYRRVPGRFDVPTEFFIRSGSLRIGDTVREFGYYEYSPSGVTHETWMTRNGCELVFLAHGRPDFLVGLGDGDPTERIQIDTDMIPYSQSKVPGPPAGLLTKTLRHSEETGARVFLCTNVPRFTYPKLEYHDCVEEAFLLVGDIWIGTSGKMTPGSYFWRPPYVTHGPFYSEAGMLALFTTDGPLVNHYVDDPERSVQENRAEAEAEGPPPDYFSERLSPAAAEGVR
jgi:hypothetical protein